MTYSNVTNKLIIKQITLQGELTNNQTMSGNIIQKIQGTRLS